jgi:pyridoxal phosphate enzyme (YggS family)
VAWHLIGHLQTNKVKDAVRIFSLIHSVDSMRLAEAIDSQAAKTGKVQDVLLQVNVSGEKTKFGLGPDVVEGVLEECSLLANIDVKGFMTIAPQADDPEEARPYFRRLREIRDYAEKSRKAKYGILSMGMTGDFEVAVEEGATIVRVGRAIFDSRINT